MLNQLKADFSKQYTSIQGQWPCTTNGKFSVIVGAFLISNSKAVLTADQHILMKQTVYHN